LERKTRSMNAFNAAGTVPHHCGWKIAM